MSGSAVDLLVVIVNYRSAELAIDCLASLQSEVQARPGTHVTVVENASGADQVARLDEAIRERGWASWVTLMVADRNGGFAAGNNVAIRWALDLPQSPRLFWLLNPDTVVRPGALQPLVDLLDREATAGLVGSRLEDPDGTVQVSAFRFPTVVGEFVDGMRLGVLARRFRNHGVALTVPSSPAPVDWVAGASLLVRRAVFDAVGLLDEGFFMYFEEVDLCRRARAAGWQCWYTPESRVVHLVGQSSGVTAAATARRRRPRYWFDARNRYFLTHHGRAATRLAYLLHWGAFASYRLRRRLQRKPDTDPDRMLWDLLRFNVLAPKR